MKDYYTSIGLFRKRKQPGWTIWVYYGKYEARANSTSGSGVTSGI